MKKVLICLMFLLLASSVCYSVMFPKYGTAEASYKINEKFLAKAKNQPDNLTAKKETGRYKFF